MNHTTEESGSIPELSKKQIQDLFLDQEEKQWCRVVPKDEKALDCTPSNSDKWYSKKMSGCDIDVKNHLKKAFMKIFTKRGHVESFWDDFTLNITHKLGLTYRKVHRLCGNLASYSEAQLQQNSYSKRSFQSCQHHSWYWRWNNQNRLFHSRWNWTERWKGWTKACSGCNDSNQQ